MQQLDFIVYNEKKIKALFNETRGKKKCLHQRHKGVKILKTSKKHRSSNKLDSLIVDDFLNDCSKQRNSSAELPVRNSLLLFQEISKNMTNSCA